MLSKKIEKALNNQIALEAAASQFYLAIASWTEVQGFEGISAFFYEHAEEERQHMLKLVRFVNERGSGAVIAKVDAPPKSFKSIAQVFDDLLKHEMKVTDAINKLVFLCLEEKDYTTHNFLQWYVSEQIEEENLARSLKDKLKLIGTDKSGLYLFDRDIQKISSGQTSANDPI